MKRVACPKCHYLNEVRGTGKHCANCGWWFVVSPERYSGPSLRLLIAAAGGALAILGAAILAGAR